MNKKDELLKLIRFGIVGILNTLVDTAVFALLITFTPMGQNLSKTISFTVGVANSYIWNKSWTFKDKNKVNVPQVLKFFGINIAAYLVSLLVLNLSNNVLHIDIAQPLKMLHLAPSTAADYAKLNLTLINLIIVTPFVLLINYIGNRLWVFRNEE